MNVLLIRNDTGADATLHGVNVVGAGDGEVIDLYGIQANGLPRNATTDVQSDDELRAAVQVGGWTVIDHQTFEDLSPPEGVAAITGASTLDVVTDNGARINDEIVIPALASNTWADVAEWELVSPGEWLSVQGKITVVIGNLLDVRMQICTLIGGGTRKLLGAEVNGRGIFADEGTLPGSFRREFYADGNYIRLRIRFNSGGEDVKVGRDLKAARGLEI